MYYIGNLNPIRVGPTSKVKDSMKDRICSLCIVNQVGRSRIVKAEKPSLMSIVRYDQTKVGTCEVTRTKSFNYVLTSADKTSNEAWNLLTNWYLASVNMNSNSLVNFLKEMSKKCRD